MVADTYDMTLHIPPVTNHAIKRFMSCCSKIDDAQLLQFSCLNMACSRDVAGRHKQSKAFRQAVAHTYIAARSCDLSLSSDSGSIYFKIWFCRGWVFESGL